MEKVWGIAMVFNSFIKCKVCGSITRIRLQVGWQEEHPVVITCGKCGISILGKAYMGQEVPSISFEFDNADILNDASKSDYMVECAGEFPTYKIRNGISINDYMNTPFLRYMNKARDDESYGKFHDNVSTINSTIRKWAHYKRIFELSQSENKEYLIQEIRKIFPEDIMPCRDQFEILRAVHMVEVHGLISPLREDLVSVPETSASILKLDSQQLNSLIEYFESHDGYSLKDMQSLIYKVYDEFITVFPYLVPAFSLQFCKEGSVDYETEGTSTSTFDLVKQFYLNTYEVLGTLLILPIALDNIKYRNDYNALKSTNKRTISLDNFIEQTKANRFHFYDQTEIYAKNLNLITNSKLRNAIGHNDAKYDTNTQKITYIPNSKDQSKYLEIFLLEFESEVIKLFQSILVISEYLYRLREFSLLKEGVIPLDLGMTSVKSKKIGRNEKCPCGSGLKYKFCHGR